MSVPNDATYPLTLFYDGACAVCNLEMDNLKARNVEPVQWAAGPTDALVNPCATNVRSSDQPATLAAADREA